MARADRFGVIAIAEPSVRRHRLYMRRMGVLDRLAGIPRSYRRLEQELDGQYILRSALYPKRCLGLAWV